MVRTADLEMIRPLEGLHVGMLTPDELDALSRLVAVGLAGREYSGVAGFLGLPRVRVYPTENCLASEGYARGDNSK